MFFRTCRYSISINPNSNKIDRSNKNITIQMMVYYSFLQHSKRQTKEKFWDGQFYSQSCVSFIHRIGDANRLLGMEQKIKLVCGIEKRA